MSSTIVTCLLILALPVMAWAGYVYGRLREQIHWMLPFGHLRRIAGSFSVQAQAGAAWALSEVSARGRRVPRDIDAHIRAELLVVAARNERPSS